MKQGYRRCIACETDKHSTHFPRNPAPGKRCKQPKVCKECRKKQRQQGKPVKKE